MASAMFASATATAARAVSTDAACVSSSVLLGMVPLERRLSSCMRLSLSSASLRLAALCLRLASALRSEALF